MIRSNREVVVFLPQEHRRLLAKGIIFCLKLGEFFCREEYGEHLPISRPKWLPFDCRILADHA